MRPFGVGLLCGLLAGCSALFPFTGATGDAGGGGDGDADADADADGDGDGDADADADGDGDADETCGIRMESGVTVETTDAAVSLVANDDFLWVVEFDPAGALLEQFERQDFGNTERLWVDDALEATGQSGFFGVDAALEEPGKLALVAGNWLLTVTVEGDLTYSSILSYRPTAVGGASSVAFEGGTILVAGEGVATFREGGQQWSSVLQCAAHDVAVAEGDVWIACGDSGVLPGTVAVAGSATVVLEDPLFAGDARAVALDSGLAIVATRHGAISVFRQEGRVALATEVGPDAGGGEDVALAVWGPYALVGAEEADLGASVLRAYDLRDPTAPERCAGNGSSVTLDAAPLALAVQGDTAYVALGDAGFGVVALSR